tara:strand:+ start:307 stop:1005 length:699 start_codon:yes stop_codon:yes gene_type:complete
MKIDENFLNQLNDNSKKLSPQDILDNSINNIFKKKMVYVCSFGTESAIILHMISDIDRSFPIILLNTNYLFKETIEYKDYLIDKFKFSDFKEISPSVEDLKINDSKGTLWKEDPDLCCNIRKVLPLQKELQKYDAWISGRKSYHEEERKNLKFFEYINKKIVVNPLAKVKRDFVNSYFKIHNIERHPLFESGYQSLGCTHCTVKTSKIDSPRSGRWANKIKTECGIHYNLKK